MTKAIAAGIGALREHLESQKERITSEGIEIINEVIDENQEIIKNPYATPEDYENRNLISSQIALRIPRALIHLKNEGEFVDRLIDYLHSSYIVPTVWWFKEQCSEQNLNKLLQIAYNSDFSDRAKLFFLAAKVINAREGNLLEDTQIPDTSLMRFCEQLSELSSNKSQIVEKAINLFFDKLKTSKWRLKSEYYSQRQRSMEKLAQSAIDSAISLSRDEGILGLITHEEVENITAKEETGDLKLEGLEGYLTDETENIDPPDTGIEDWESDYNNYERYTKIEFPEKCALDKPATLTVQLVINEPTHTRHSGKVKFRAPKEENLVKINVIVTASQFALRKTMDWLIVPVDADSNIVSFKLFPQELGQQQIEIQFDYKGNRIGYAVVLTTVENSDEASGEEAAPNQKHTANSIIYDEPAKANLAVPERKALYVDEIYEGKLKYMGVIDGEVIDYVVDKVANLEEIAENISKILGSFSRIVDPKEETWEAINANLTGIGTDLFGDLIPKDLRQAIRTWEKGTTVCISEKNPAIPWEYMYDGESFLGEKFILWRKERVDGNNRETPVKKQVQNDNGDKKYIINVVGGGLTEFERKALNLFNKLSDERWETLPNILKKPLPSLTKTLNKADIVHFTCHCKLKPIPMIQIFEDDSVLHHNLQPQTVRSLGIKDGALVFANACSSGVLTLYFAGFVNFGSRFIFNGAKIYIGTLGEIPTEYAIEFAKDFYHELFNKEQKTTVGMALAKAKEKAKEKRNIFWLLYCLYGDPDFSI